MPHQAVNKIFTFYDCYMREYSHIHMISNLDVYIIHRFHIEKKIAIYIIIIKNAVK